MGCLWCRMLKKRASARRCSQQAGKRELPTMVADKLEKQWETTGQRGRIQFWRQNKTQKAVCRPPPPPLFSFLIHFLLFGKDCLPVSIKSSSCMCLSVPPPQREADRHTDCMLTLLAAWLVSSQYELASYFQRGRERKQSS